MDRNDILGVIGGGLYAIGAWMVNPALCLITTGLILLFLAVMGARAPRGGGEKK
jgi:hypothetical protein